MKNGTRATAVALWAALAVAGCASELPSPTPLPGEVRVIPVERRAFDADPEPGLYRVEFDAVRVKALLPLAWRLAHELYEGDGRAAEVAALERDAAQELRARGKCNGLARLASPAGLGDGSRPVSAVFKCAPPVF